MTADESAKIVADRVRRIAELKQGILDATGVALTGEEARSVLPEAYNYAGGRDDAWQRVMEKFPHLHSILPYFRALRRQFVERAGRK